MPGAESQPIIQAAAAHDGDPDASYQAALTVAATMSTADLKAAQAQLTQD